MRWLIATMAAALGILSPVAHAAVPAQYIAKIYTEALGRAPDTGGWNARIAYFQQHPCTVPHLKAHGQGIFASQEFQNIGYSNSAKVLVLYRTILDREPDAAGYAAFLNQLDAGTPLASVVDSFYDSGEFNQLSALICGGGPYYFNALGGQAYAIRPPGTATITQQALQQQLNATPAGGTVALPGMAVVYLSSPLTIPAGVTLTTAGSPSPAAHAAMARIVRAPNYAAGAALISIAGGGTLSHVWVDGQRGAGGTANGVPQPYVYGDINIQTLSGAGTGVTSNFIANTAGWSSLQVLGSAELPGTPCRSTTIAQNLITAYASSNSDTAGKTWADGISVSCENALVAQNQIVDASDGAIVLFRAQVNGVGAVQTSQVVDNTILNAGNDAYVGIAVDPLYVPGGCSAMPDFTGSYVGRNRMWTGPGATIEIGLAVGTSEWFFSQGGCVGRGANVSDNTTGGVRSRFNDGIAVQGMLDAVVQSNELLTTRVTKGHCASHDVAAGVSAGLASGSLQPYVDVALTDCI